MKNLIIAVFAVFLMSTVQAQLITVGGTEYDILWEIGSFNDVNATRGLEAQLWWQDVESTLAFAAALGGVDDQDQLNGLGPLFAADISEEVIGGIGGVFALILRTDVAAYDFVTGTVNSFFVSRNVGVAWAYAAAPATVPVPVPGSLALIALGLAGLGVTRKVRR